MTFYMTFLTPHETAEQWGAEEMRYRDLKNLLLLSYLTLKRLLKIIIKPYLIVIVLYILNVPS